MRRPFWIVVTAGLLIAACGAGETGTGADSNAAYLTSVEEWRADRIARLKAPEGYLNQIGLFWLAQGSSSFGSSNENDIVVPAVGDAKVAVFDVDADGVTMVVEVGVDVRHDGKRVDVLQLPDDTTESPILVRYRSVAWSVIKRDGKFALRVRDYDHPVLQTFPDIPHFDVRPEWRVDAVLRRFAEPKIMNVETVIEGLGYNPQSPGVVEFELDGERYELEAYESGDRLFFVFGDRTSGRETYPAGRFLYADAPDEDGKTVLDFNFAYNPPCAFNDFSTCPVASPRNRLRIAVNAGEKFVDALHPDSIMH